MATLNLTTPWVEYYRKIDAIFKNDSEVNVLYNNDTREICIFVNNGAKANAIDTLLPDTINFGNVELTVNVIPSNGKKLEIPRNLYSVAFTGNSAVERIETVEGIFSNPITYIIFKKEVVQYYNDDLGDYFGVRSTLYETIAQEIFNSQEGVYFCTNIE